MLFKIGNHNTVEFLSSNLKFRLSVEVPLSKGFCRSNCVVASRKSPKTYLCRKEQCF